MLAKVSALYLKGKIKQLIRISKVSSGTNWLDKGNITYKAYEYNDGNLKIKINNK